MAKGLDNKSRIALNERNGKKEGWRPKSKEASPTGTETETQFEVELLYVRAKLSSTISADRKTFLNGGSKLDSDSSEQVKHGKAAPDSQASQSSEKRKGRSKKVEDATKKKESVHDPKIDAVTPSASEVARNYDKETRDSIQKASVAKSYQGSLDAAKKYNDVMSAAIKYPAASAESPKAVPSEPVSEDELRSVFGTKSPETLPPPSEPVTEPELRSVFGTGERPNSRRLGRGENIGRQRELGPVAGSHLRNTCRNAQQAPENAERRSWWGFFKERVKGFATLGILEFWHAEKFRRGTKRTAGEVTAQSSMLDQTRDMDIDQAQEEANRIRQMVGASLTGGPQSLTTGNILNIQAASNQIDAEKAASNTRLMNRIVAQARGNVQERLAKYKNQFGQNVVGDERLAQFEERLRAELASSTIGRGIREPSVIKREINFKQAVRERLDKNYWSRYVYGTLDLLAWGGIAKLASGYLASGGMNLAPVPVPGTETVPMHDTIWKTAGEWLQQQGISNPTNAQIMDISKQVAIDNGIGVKEWGIAGNPLDTVMQQDHALKFVGPALKAIMASW